jgi:hypothetical protein
MFRKKMFKSKIMLGYVSSCYALSIKHLMKKINKNWKLDYIYFGIVLIRLIAQPYVTANQTGVNRNMEEKVIVVVYELPELYIYMI